MNIKIYACWNETEYGYIIGSYWVEGENEQYLMSDEDMYYNLGKFLTHIKKRFVDNPRFDWEKATVNLENRFFEITGWDNGRKV